MDSSLIPLGSGHALPWDVHPSLALLHQLKLFNFPVPKGVILLQPRFLKGTLHPDELATLEMELKNRDFSNPLTLFFFASPNPKLFSSDLKSSTDLKVTLEDLFLKLPQKEEGAPNRLDLLISEKPKTQVRGTAISQDGFLDDWLNFQLTSEEQVLPEVRLPIGKLLAGEKRLRGDFRGRVQDLLRSIRQALGEDNWCLSWSDDGDNIFLNQLAPYKLSGSWEDKFLRFPFFENTPSSPSLLESSLISLSSSKLFQFFSPWAAELSSSRRWVQHNENELLFNVSLLEDFLRSFGLSTQVLFLLKTNLEHSSHPANSVRFWRAFPRLVRFLHHLILAPGIGNRLSSKLRNFDTSPEKTINELFLEWQSIYISSSHCLYRIWSFYFVAGSLLRVFGFPSDLLQKSPDGIDPSIRRLLYPLFKLGEKLNLTESILRQSSKAALSKIHRSIEIKSLGWFARGLLPSAEAVWSLNYEAVIGLDSHAQG